MSEQRKLTSIVIFSILAIMAATALIPRLTGITPEWGGSDDVGMTAIGGIEPGYKPWFSPVWQPPSREIESLLFALQAAIGAGIIGYVAGYYTGQKR